MHNMTEEERERFQKKLDELSPYDRILYKFYMTRLRERERLILVRKRKIRRTAAVYRRP
jgi:hypothetical protein